MSLHALLPLETFAQTLFANHRDQMPDRNADYWARYASLLAGLREYVYPHINAGLSCLSKSPGIYTDHGPEHFDEVIRYAGLLLGIPTTPTIDLNPYEVYLLLCAIRLHDAGNIDGREEHEKRTFYMLEKYGGNIAHDTAEATLISRIAEAHGGKTMSGSKDTIGELPEDGISVAAITCRPRQVAALVRFADEICEHASRAARHHLTANTLPNSNKLFHLYANSVVGATCKPGKSFKLRLAVDTQWLVSKYAAPANAEGVETEKYFVDEILDRISKLELERRYCNQFLIPGMQTDELEVRIELTQAADTSRAPVQVDCFEFRIPTKRGYPAAHDHWREDVPGLKGDKMAERANQGWK